jgi:hypothetical protein
MLDSLSKNLIEGDIVEDRGDTVYVGLFDNNKDENSPDGCIIKRVQTYLDEQTNYAMTVIKYANGDSMRFSCAWHERENYQYKYASGK